MADIRNNELDDIFGRASLTGETLLAEVRNTLVRRIARRPLGNVLDSETMTLARSILERVEPVFAQSLVDARLAAASLSVIEIDARLPDATKELIQAASSGRPPIGPLTPLSEAAGNQPVIRFPVLERAAESVAERNPVTRAVFDQMDIDAQAKAFTVARQVTEESIERIRDVVNKGIREGWTPEIFRDSLGDSLEGGFIGPGHISTVYRTNVQTAFHKAHDEFASMPVVNEVFRYQKYLPISDSRVRDEHLALATLGIDGTNVYRRDDRAFWDAFLPPWDFSCRCGVSLLTVEAAARSGVREAIEWQETGVMPPLVSRLPDIPFRPDPDFVGVRGVSSAA